MRKRSIVAVLAIAFVLVVSGLQPAVFADELSPEVPPETSTVPYGRKQSDGVTFECTHESMDDGKEDPYVFTYTITDQAKGDLVLDLTQCWKYIWENESSMPGDSIRLQVDIVNNSQTGYTYQDESFVLAPGDASKHGTIEDGTALPVLTYDGQYLPISRASSMIPAPFVGSVFGCEADKVTFEMMCQLPEKLVDLGYNSETPVSDYMLEYYNETYGTSYGSLAEMFGDNPDWIDKTQVTDNGIWEMSQTELDGYIESYPWIEQFVRYSEKGNEQLSVQIKWPEPEMAAVSYNAFYTGLFSAAYGQENVDRLDPNPSGDLEFSRSHAIGDYQPGTELYAETNDYFKSLTQNDQLASGGQITVPTAYGIDGPAMGNTYQNYDFDQFCQIVLEAENDPVAIQPLDIITYTGGADYDGTADDNGVVNEDNGFPTPGFSISAPEGVEDFDPAKAKLVYDDGQGDRRVWNVESYDGTEGVHNVYTFEPAEGNDKEVRVQFELPDGTVVTDDEFEIEDYLNETLTMHLYMDGIENDYVSLEYDGEDYPVDPEVQEDLTGELTVRSSTDELDYGDMVSSEQEVAAAEPGLIANPNADYFVNDSVVQVEDPVGVKLLFDEIIEDNASDTKTTDMLVDRAKDELAKAGEDAESATRGFEAKYLDLVDTNNGNAWVSCEEPVTVCWPIPEGVSADSDFHVLHFKGLHREMRTDEVASDIQSCDVEEMPVKVDGSHITFQVSRANFSPFVLTWDDAATDAGGENPDDSQKPETPDNPGTPDNPETPGNTEEPGKGTEGDALPTTGDSSLFAVVGTAVVAAACVAGGVALRKKRRS